MIECIVAPIAESENDSISDNEKPICETKEEIKLRRSYSDPLDISLESTLSSSLEDLISTFDEKIFKCFQDFTTDTREIAPLVDNKDILKESKWWQNSYGEDKMKDEVSAKINQLNWNELTDIPDKNSIVGLAVDSTSLKSAEGLLMEIHEMMDYSDNNVDFEGIEESFYDSDLSESVKDIVVMFQSEWSNKEGTEKWKNALSTLNLDALRIIVNDMKARVRTLSDCLLIHLVTRDELEFEREVRDRFMLLLQGVQRRKKDFARNVLNQRHNAAELRQRNRNANRWSWNGNWSTIFRNQKSKLNSTIPLEIMNDMKLNDNNNNNNDSENETSSPFAIQNKNTRMIRESGFTDIQFEPIKTPFRQSGKSTKSLENTIKYLSTTIPFKSGVSSTNIQHLQIFNKILLAILQENSKLDNILTDYLLNVYTAPIEGGGCHLKPDSCNNYNLEATCP